MNLDSAMGNFRVAAAPVAGVFNSATWPEPTRWLVLAVFGVAVATGATFERGED